MTSVEVDLATCFFSLIAKTIAIGIHSDPLIFLQAS